MCGICGMINDTRENIMEGMLDKISHRGPDGRGFCVTDSGIIGNVRLSVIDNMGGKQPFESTNKRFVTVYNGEIYGYKELREELKRAGYNLKSHSDTELLPALYEKMGLNIFTKLNGMFSFIIYDRLKKRYIIARDHFGIKPLVYTVVGNKLYFSSEIKSFYAIPQWRAKEDINSWHSFMNIRFTPSPNTLFEGVKKLSAGHLMIISDNPQNDILDAKDYGFQKENEIVLGNKTATVFKYYSISNDSNRYNNYTANDLDSILTNVIKNQIVADDMPGIYLSGGIDSSLITYFASQDSNNKPDTYCLGFGSYDDENLDAKLVSDHLKTNHHDFILNDNSLDYYRNSIYHTEEPKVNSLQGYMLSSVVSKNKKVMLSGLGGDELFGGYDVYAIARLIDKTGILFNNTILSRAGTLIKNSILNNTALSLDIVKRGLTFFEKNRDPLALYLLLRNGWDWDNLLMYSVYKKNPFENDAEPVYKVMQSKFKEYNTVTESFMKFEFENKMVDDFLVNEDRTSMAHGLEVRVPLLDKKVAEFAFSLPVDAHIDIFNRKKILKKFLTDKLPRGILSKKKQGFSFNSVVQFKKNLKQMTNQYLSEDIVEDAGMFRYDFIKKILESKPNNFLRWHYFMLWQIMGYHIWHSIFIKNRGEL